MKCIIIFSLSLVVLGSELACFVGIGLIAHVFIFKLFVFMKPQLLAATKFIAHLVNQLVAHEIIALELLTVLLENPTDDSVEVEYLKPIIVF